MYYRYFGLQEEPFSIAVNPKYLFMSARHRDALAHLLYGVGAGGGFILLTGEVGTGKTTINRCLLAQLPVETDIAIILNPALNADELLATVCDELHIDYDKSDYTLKTLTDRLHAFLLDNHSRGRNTVLLIDEAQHLQFDVLEQIRLLTNLETNTRKLLQIILVGQPELTAMLAKPELRQLNQRITARYDLRPLNLEETDAYIRHRLQVAGLPANQELFPAAVVRGIHRKTRGIPRLINVLCDRMLLGTYGQNKTQVDRPMLRQAAAEVLGEEPASRSAGMPWAAVALVLAVATGVLLWRTMTPSQPATAVVAASVEPVASAPVDSRPAQRPTATPEPMAVDPPEPRELNPAALAVSEKQMRPETAAWHGSRERALRALAGYVQAPVPPGGDFCSAARETGLACEVQIVQTWQELFDFDRPAVLTLVTPARFAAFATLVGVSDNGAIVLHEGEEMLLPLVELGELWRGEFIFLWQPPADYSGPIGLGARSPMVAWLAREFALLDGQPEPLAGDEFNTALDERVRLFQRQFNLLDDGVVGLKTLLKFNEARGMGRSLSRPEPALATVEIR